MIPENEQRMSMKELFNHVVSREDGGERFVDLQRGFGVYGYRIAALPFPSTYDRFCDEKEKALIKVQEKAEQIRKYFKYRGLSKNLLSELHAQLPEPEWGVHIDEYLI